MQENTQVATETTGTDIALLPPAQRAVIVLDSTKAEQKLKELVAQSADIKEVKDAAGRDLAHRTAMTLRNTRTAITSTGKKAREDATAFSKAVIDEEKRLIAISQPEEDRIFALRDAYDAEQARIKAENERKERERVAGIKAKIDSIRKLGAESAFDSAADIEATLDDLIGLETSEAMFAEFTGDAAEAKAQAMTELQALLVKAQAAEAEAARVAAERAELERLRAEQAERDRLAAEERAREEAERQRVAAETKRQLEAQQAAIAEERRQAEAAMQAEREAFEAERRAFQEQQAAAAAAAAKPPAEQFVEKFNDVFGLNENAAPAAPEPEAEQEVVHMASFVLEVPASEVAAPSATVQSGEMMDLADELTASTTDDSEMVEGFKLIVMGLYATRSADAIRELLDSVLADLEGTKVAA